MKILFTSGSGNAVPLAREMIEENHEVKMHVKTPEDREIGNGFVEKVKDWQAELDWADLVICDEARYGKQNDSIRRLGIPVVGGTVLSDALEENRGAGQRMFKALGMQVLNTVDFKSIEDAVKYVRKNPKRYVVKVSGSAQDDKTTTYVGESDDGRDIEPVLFHMKQKKHGSISSVEIQDRVSGVEVAIGGFFNGKEFLDPVFLNFEHKKLMSHPWEQAGIGPATGEMGTVGCWKDKGFKLYRETLDRFVPILIHEGYRGYFDINCIIEMNGLEPIVRPLEMTNRFGWPTLPLQIETMRINDLGELFHGIATGEVSDFKVSYPYSVCIVVGVPPLPYTSQELADEYSVGMPLIFRDPTKIESIYPGDCYLEDGQWKLTGDSGYACVCAGAADSIEEASSLAYAKVDNVIVANKMWRTDIGSGVPARLNQISSLLQHETARV